ncbi:DUF547 domain-containing protein [Christiangramia aquimixticola]|uniref:DUF547 domain-containing protein n=1 Tax=Christiangramia aquimixticola TaxID=1697558 RepID=UPI003AA9CD52
MRKFILNFGIMITGVYMCASCNLISSAGFNDKGLPTPDAEKIEQFHNSTKIDHSIWDELLKAHVKKDGKVDYQGFKKDRFKLDLYLNKLSGLKPDGTWSRAEILAYYINLYNAYTVDFILQHYPVASIKDISGAWTREFIKIGDVKISLGGIENSLLRKMEEPRIHFAINCASISCPKLLNEAYTPEKLEEQLEKVTAEFINSNENQITPDSVKLSSIFDWYKSDFTQNGSLIDYLNKYSEVRINSAARISYNDYNWALNDSK